MKRFLNQNKNRSATQKGGVFKENLNEAKTQDDFIKFLKKAKWSMEDIVDFFYAKLPRKLWMELYDEAINDIW